MVSSIATLIAQQPDPGLPASNSVQVNALCVALVLAAFGPERTYLVDGRCRLLSRNRDYKRLVATEPSRRGVMVPDMAGLTTVQTMFCRLHAT